MAYIWIPYHWLSVLGFLTLLSLAIYALRYKILAYMPPKFQARFPQYAPVPDFEAAQTAGFDSGHFDLSLNLNEGDHRQLDIDEVRRIMSQKGCTFDEARLIRHKRHLARNGIDPVTGLPTDRKAITSLS